MLTVSRRGASGLSAFLTNAALMASLLAGSAFVGATPSTATTPPSPGCLAVNDGALNRTVLLSDPSAGSNYPLAAIVEDDDTFVELQLMQPLEIGEVLTFGAEVIQKAAYGFGTVATSLDGEAILDTRYPAAPPSTVGPITSRLNSLQITYRVGTGHPADMNEIVEIETEVRFTVVCAAGN